MTREEAQAFITAIVNIRKSVNDDTALSTKAVFPRWRADKDYVVDDRVRFDDNLYKCLLAHSSQESWKPNVSSSLWAKVLIPDPNVIPEWEQPNSTNPYKKGDKVMYNNKKWISTVDNNVWTPGEYGWDEITD